MGRCVSSRGSCCTVGILAGSSSRIRADVGSSLTRCGSVCVQMMSQAQGQHRDLIQSIEELPAAPGPGLSPLDQDLLMLKATSMATMSCLSECLHILQLQQVARQRAALGGEWLELCCIIDGNRSSWPSGQVIRSAPVKYSPGQVEQAERRTAV